MKNRILGIDPSLSGTGLVIIENWNIIKQELVKTKPTQTMMEELARLLTITNKVIEIIEQDGNIGLVIIEDLAVGVSKTSALTQLAGLNYLIRYKILLRKIPLITIKPTSTKKYLGKGNFKKQEMLLHTYTKFGVEFKDDNLCDAYVMARIAEDVILNPKQSNEKSQEVVDLLRPQFEILGQQIKEINII